MRSRPIHIKDACDAGRWLHIRRRFAFEVAPLTSLKEGQRPALNSGSRIHVGAITGVDNARLEYQLGRPARRSPHPALRP